MTDSQSQYVWFDRTNAWLYVHISGVVRGRVDRISCLGRPPWYWWQTPYTSDSEMNLSAAKRLVERMIDWL